MGVGAYVSAVVLLAGSIGLVASPADAAIHTRAPIEASDLTSISFSTPSYAIGLLRGRHATARVVVTGDGGAGWHRTNHAAFDGYDLHLTSTANFAAVWGGHGLFTSRTAGQHWHRAPDGHITQVVQANGRVWAMRARCHQHQAHPTHCRERTVVSTDHGRTWRRLGQIPEAIDPRTDLDAMRRDGRLVVVSRTTAYLLAPGAGTSAGLFTTDDGGAHWSALPTPCRRDFDLPSSDALSATGVDDLWLVCGGEPMTDMSAKTLYRSWNGGTSWLQVARVLVDGPSSGTLPSTGSADRIVATSPTTAYLYGYRSTLARTTDGGFHWTTSTRPGGRRTDFASGGFATLGGTHAWAWFDLEPYLWSTTDSGAHWSRVFAPGSQPTPRCRPDELVAHVVTTGSEMSQPYVLVAVANRADTTCKLRGYPTIAASDTAGFLRIREHDSSVYEVRDRGPHVRTLKPGQRLRFAIGTATAYDGGRHLLTITRLTITPPYSQAAILTSLTVSLPASHPRGRPIPISVTALMHHNPCGSSLRCAG